MREAEKNGGSRQRARGRLSAGPLHLVVVVVLAAILAAGGAVVFAGRSATAFVAPNVVAPVAQPVIGAPRDTQIFGSSPGETAGETWGYSTSGGFSIVRYRAPQGRSETEASGSWQAFGLPLDNAGQPLSGFTPAAGALAGRTTASGGVVIVGQDSAKTGQVLVRDPGGAFREAPPLTTETIPAQPGALLKPGETVSAANGEGVLTTAFDQSGAPTGVFLVPFESASTHVQEDVLYYDGARWKTEPICEGINVTPCKAPASGFKVLAIDASSQQNAWLLASTGSGADGIVLFSRNTSGPAPQWDQRSLGGAGTLGGQFAQATPSFKAASVRIVARTHGQSLTAAGQGVWVDGLLTINGQSQQPTDFTLFYSPQAEQVTASWCDVSVSEVATSMCTHALGSELPRGVYRSFAWSEGGPFGRRVITGLDQGVTLSLRGEDFVRLLGAGGESGTVSGAAFSSPEEGWLANSTGGPLTHLTTHPAPNQLQSWPVSFRRPLSAIAEQPGAASGELGAQAIAVGENGEVARYVPGQGWAPEALLSSSGTVQTLNLNLRGVAWPEPGRAYAVGSGGAMWLWRAETGLWEPDPARPPNLYPGNFTGIAFDPSNPARGYAIGQQGLLLGYGKSWSQEPLPPGLSGANFTSIAFAGGEAIVSYQIPHFDPSEGYGRGYSGGLLVNDGGGWSVVAEAGLGLGHIGVPVKVAGLPDGGAALATENGEVLERQGGPGTPWSPAPAGAVEGFPVALAAFREGGTLRATVSIDNEVGDHDYKVDEALQQQPGAGQAPVATPPYPLPGSGFVLRESASGWQDQEHQAYPLPYLDPNSGGKALDWPAQPDAVLALALAPDGSQGWAVGGQTGQINLNVANAESIETIQTAGVMRYPAGGQAPIGFASAPVQTGATMATFAIGGNAQCATACANLAEDQLGPDAWLANALGRAAQTPGVRAFLYTGAHLAPGLVSATDASGFHREVSRYAELLSSSGGPPAVFAAPSASDLDGTGTLQSFTNAFSAFASPQGSGASPPGVAPVSPAAPGGAQYFSFDSTGPGGSVRVIVLDYSSPALGALQQCWLATELAGAKAGAKPEPAIVIGSRELNSAGQSHNVAADAAQVAPILVNGTPPQGCAAGPAGGTDGASAYFYDYPEENHTYPISAGGASIPTFGSGTLGYVNSPTRTDTAFLGASGFLLAEVETAKRNPATNRAPVSTRLIPDISDLALDATNGTLLRRSQPSLFSALARRPHAGMDCVRAGPSSCTFVPDPYVPIPSRCTGATCATGILPYYTFTSSNPDVGNFVQPDPASTEGTTVLQGPEGKPIPDPHSGLFCAYNPGTTTVTVEAGGLSSSEQVTVQGGSVEQPCGTVPLRNPPAPEQRASLPVPPPAPAPAPTPSPKGALPPPPPVPAQVPALKPAISAHILRPHPVPAPPVPLAPAQLFPILPLVPPPAPSAARPTPPSGTAQVPSQSPVSQTVGVAEREEEEQGATEMVHHMVAYERHREEGPMPSWPLALLLVLAVSGAVIRRPKPELARVRTFEHGPRSGPPHDQKPLV